MTKLGFSLTLLVSALNLGACTLLDATVSERAIIDTPCASDAECPTGFECEIEEEHGTTTSFCKADEDTGGDCPAGYEQEIEHGQIFCKPHGGDDDDSDGGHGGSDDSDDDSDGGIDPGTGVIECETDADCGAGLECEVEVEHGVTTATCEPHGGDDD
jgi:Cys-rich repeat protein